MTRVGGTSEAELDAAYQAYRAAMMAWRASSKAGHPATGEAAADRPVSVVSVPGLVTPFFAAEPPQDFAAASACDLDAYGRFAGALLDRGVYPPASQFEAWFVSLAHDEAAIDRTIEAAGDAFGVAFTAA